MSGEKEELKAFTTAGFFGSEFGPMNLPFPEAGRRVGAAAGGDDGQPFANRDRLFRKLVDQSPQRDFMSDYQQQSMLRSMDNAYRLLSSPEREAFDISLEPQESLRSYDTGRFGRGCLLARRLVEAGSPVRRGHDRIRALPALGYARQGPRNGGPDAQRDRSARSPS